MTESKKERRSFYILAAIAALLVVIALLAPLLAPNDPYETNLMAAQAGPSPEYPLGTDSLGRCMLSRVLYGARLSIFTSLLITAIVFCLGMTIGSLCGYFGGIVDLILNKIITIMQAFPQIILAIAITGIMGIGIRNTIIALCMVLWVDYARLSRSFVFSVKDRDFIKAAKVCGESDMRILFKRIIPNIMKPLIENGADPGSRYFYYSSGLSYVRRKTAGQIKIKHGCIQERRKYEEKMVIQYRGSGYGSNAADRMRRRR